MTLEQQLRQFTREIIAAEVHAAILSLGDDLARSVNARTVPASELSSSTLRASDYVKRRGRKPKYTPEEKRQRSAEYQRQYRAKMKAAAKS